MHAKFSRKAWEGVAGKELIALAAMWRTDLRGKNEIGGIIRSLARRQRMALELRE